MRHRNPSNATTPYTRRQHSWERGRNTVFDVAVIGGGIKGASIYHRLCNAGYRTLLIEKGDFASGTSQASCMMIWGGLLYLTNWDLATVWRLSSARNTLVHAMPDCIRTQTFQYFPQHAGALKRLFFRAVLGCYGFFGPNSAEHAASPPSLKDHFSPCEARPPKALAFNEAMVVPSDARFVLQLVLRLMTPDHLPLNYCELEGGQFDHGRRLWKLLLHDTVRATRAEWNARWVINAAGAATDSINRLCDIESPYKHVLSRGVSLILSRNPGHQAPTIYDIHGTVMPFLPWGPVSIWGPTETLAHHSDQARIAQPEDIRFLFNELRRSLPYPVAASDIVAIRCGVRTLATDASSSTHLMSHKLSRRTRIHVDGGYPWMALYGGTFTSATTMAADVQCLLKKLGLAPTAATPSSRQDTGPLPERIDFPGLIEPVHSPRWCADHELCWTLEDYLRRRTNIAQWVHRGGLGRDDEHLSTIEQIAHALHPNNPTRAATEISQYRSHIKTGLDQLLSSAFDGEAMLSGRTRSVGGHDSTRHI